MPARCKTGTFRLAHCVFLMPHTPYGDCRREPDLSRLAPFSQAFQIGVHAMLTEDGPGPERVHERSLL